MTGKTFIIFPGFPDVLGALKYRHVFSLRDEIGTCPNIEVEIDITDQSPFSQDHTMLERKTKHLLTRK